MRILDIPNEILLSIAEKLSIKDLFHFLSTCHRLSSLLIPRLHNLGVQDADGVTALQWAAYQCHASLAKLAISRGAEIDRELSRQTPLHLAAFRNNRELIRILVENGARINGKGSGTTTPLHLAASWECLRAIKMLLELGADMTLPDESSDTPAHLAARESDIGCMRAFIDAGFDCNIRGCFGRTILHQAAATNTEVLQYLLGTEEGRTVINAVDFNGLTVLSYVQHYCSGVELEEKVRLILQHIPDTELRH